MRVALLLGADPKNCNEFGPKVKLIVGVWKLVESGITDSVYALYLDNFIHENNEFILRTNTVAQVRITSRGKESSITILAERIGNVT